MTMERWDATTAVSFDQAMWAELGSLRFVAAGHNAVIMGPVGVGKTFLATALGHAAVRRRYSVHFERTDTSCAGSRRHGSTTATTPRSASCCGWTC